MTSILLLAGLLLAQGADRRPATTDALEAFESAAAKIERLEMGTVLYGRIAEYSEYHGSQPLAELAARHDPVESIEPLLAHSDPRVRTLAAIGLFDRDEPAWLPRIAALAHDDARSFPTPLPIARQIGANETPPVEQRTVGAWAKAMVEHYMLRAGFAYGVDGQGTEPGFDVYWNARKDRKSCASWWSIRLERAFGGSSPMQPSCLERVRRVRADVDRLPAQERALLLLYLPDLESKFSTESDRLAAARVLGREKLLAILRREPPGDDPDFHERGNSQVEEYVLLDGARFVLMHANALLEPADAVALLELARAAPPRETKQTGEPITWALWEIAAAQLQPAGARSVLLAGFDRFAAREYWEGAEGRAQLMQAFWQQGTAADDAWIADKFYAETLVGDMSPPSRTKLVEMLGRDGSPRARATLATIVRHPKFDSLEVESLRAVVFALNALTKREIVARDELYRISHPWSITRLVTADQIAKASVEWPEQTRAFLEKLAAWRKAVLASVDEWSPSSKQR